jgi:prepilin-type N-terminal cleavage/methylation domain-containing protein
MRSPARRAFTLIEMVIAISVAAALTGVAVSLLLVLFRAEQSGRSYIAQAETLRRLADQFRRDAHAAARVAVNQSDPQGWQFDLAGDSIVRYTKDSDGLRREEEKSAKNVGTETYTLPKDSTPAIEVDRAAKPPVVSLTIKPGDASLRPGREFRIDAVLARDLRFATPRKEGK